MAESVIKEFITSLRDLEGAGSSVSENAARDLLKNLKSDIPELNKIVHDLPVTTTDAGYLLIGGAPVGQLTKLFKSADLAGIVKLGKTATTVTKTDELAFKAIVGRTPEVSYREVSENATALKSKYPGLDSQVTGIDALPDSAKKNIETIENNLRSKFKDGAVVVITIGAIVVGAQWLKNATAARSGCFLLTTIDGKTTSCKIAQCTCIKGAADIGSPCTNVPKLYNYTLALLSIAQRDNTDTLKINVAKAANIDVSNLQSNLGAAIDKSFTAMVETINSSPPALNNICGLSNPTVENGHVPDCRMCSVTALPTSTEYIDSKLLGDNITVQCVSNPSILDTVADAAKTTGVDLMDGISKPVKALLKIVIISGILIVLLLVVFAFIVNILKKQKKDIDVK